MATRKTTGSKTSVAKSGATQTASYQHTEAQAIIRPEAGAQTRFKKKKPTATWHYDSSLAPELQWDALNPAREQGEARIAALQTALASMQSTLAEVEQQLLAAHELPDAELFVAGHHGSKYSSCEELLSALNAEYAVVSCGYNSYGHPTQEALGRFESAGMEILRTDYMGNITLRIGG